MSEILDKFAKQLMKRRDELFKVEIDYCNEAKQEPWRSMTEEQRKNLLKHQLINIDYTIYTILASVQSSTYTIYDTNQAVDLLALCLKEHASTLDGMFMPPSDWIMQFSKYPPTLI